MNFENLYWGDLHSHCSISYGKGSLDKALSRAKSHLDFCSITAHSSWPDMPKDLNKYNRIISMHMGGFAKAKAYWAEAKEKINKANQPGEFVAIPSYEWHSMKYGDYIAYWLNEDPPLLSGETLEDFIDQLPNNQTVFLIPHHIGYKQGFRGINWKSFNENISPAIEVFSGHGCALSENDPYPYYHSMGPRDSASTAVAGLNKGKKFGFFASTDDHGAYPGNYGHGRIGVFCNKLTKKNIFKAIKNRKTIAVTGDKIEVDFRINDGFIGDSIVLSKKRNIQLKTKASDYLDKVEIWKNGKLFTGKYDFQNNNYENNEWKIRLEWGWGDPNDLVKWNGNIKVVDGVIKSVEPCFRGISSLDPSANKTDYKSSELENKIIKQNNVSVNWVSQTKGSQDSLKADTSSLVLEIKGDIYTVLKGNINGIKFSYSLKELLKKSKTKYLDEFLSPVFKIHSPISKNKYCASLNIIDNNDSAKVEDYYYARIIQKNGQAAWSSPIWVKG